MGVVLSVAGLALSSGGFTGGFWWGVGSLLLGNALSGAPQGQRIYDLKRQTSDGDWPIPLAFGHVRLAGNLIWCSDLKEEKKGGSKKKGTPSTYAYRQSGVVLFCEGPIKRFEKLSYNADREYLWRWNGGDQKGLRFQEEFANGQSTGVWHSQNKRTGSPNGLKALLLGTDKQTVLPQLESVDGVGNVPAYNHRCCFLSHNESLADKGNQFPQVNAWIEGYSNDVADIIRVILAKSARALGYPIDTSSDVTKDLDVSQLRGLSVEGLVVSDKRGAVRAIEQLALVHAFDFVRAGYQLVARLRSSYDLNAVRRLDLPSPGAGAQWGRPQGGGIDPTQVRGESVLQSAMKTPGRFEMTFYNPAKKNRSDWVRSGYFPGAVAGSTGAFPARSSAVQNVDTSLTLSRAIARTVTRRALYEIQLARKSQTHNCAPSLVDCYPSELVFDGENIFKISALNSELWGPQHLTLSPFDLYLYNRMAPDTGIETSAPDLTLEYTAPVVWAGELLALPFYALPAPFGGGGDAIAQGTDLASFNRDNPCVAIAASVDNTEVFGTPLASLGAPDAGNAELVTRSVDERFSERACLGRLVEPRTPGTEFDDYTGDSFQLDVLGGSLESVSVERFRSGYGSANGVRPDGSSGAPVNILVWQNGSIISFRDAELDEIINIGGKQWSRYTLSGIRYGLWGSDDVRRELTPDDPCLLLWDSAGALAPGWVLKKWPLAVPNSSARLTVWTGPGEVGVGDADAVGVEEFFYVGQAQTPLAPNVRRAYRQNNGLVLEGGARSRGFSDGWWEGAYPLPLFEQSEAQGYRYELELVQGAVRVKKTVFAPQNRAEFRFEFLAGELLNWGLDPQASLSGTLALVDRGRVGRTALWGVS